MKPDPPVRCPTRRQYGLLLNLGSGAVWVAASKGASGPLLRHGWVVDESADALFLRITPDGLRALAAAVEKFGLPSMTRPLETQAKACSECGHDWRPRCRCGGRSYRFVTREVEVPA